MLKTLLTGVIALLFLLSSFIPFTSGYDNTSNNSIQEMIDNANSGDTIYVDSGTYYEQIIVDKPLTIIGDGAESTIIDGIGLDEHIFNVVSDNVDISGFTIKNCSIGFSGIRVNNDSCNIHHNIFRDCGGGVELWDVKDVFVHNNTIEDNTWGVYVHSSINCGINDNTIIENFYGMEMGYSTVEIRKNLIENNSVSGILGLWIENVLIDRNEFNNNDFGLNFFSSNRNMIQNNIIKNSKTGVSLYESKNNNIKNNNISEHYYGIYFWLKSDNNIIENNFLNSNSYSIITRHSNNNSILINNISNNNFVGIYLSYSSNYNIIKQNFMNNNRRCIDIKFSSNYNSINGNNIKYSRDFCIRLYLSSNNYVIKNNISNSEFFGILLERCLINSVFDNVLHSCGVAIWSPFFYDWIYHSIENNTANNKPIRYYKNQTDVVVPEDTGQIIIANCSNFTIKNLGLSNICQAIIIGFSSDINVIGNNISNHNCDGVQLTFSSYCLIKSNNLTGKEVGDGIWLGKSSNNTIIDNNIQNYSQGVELQCSSNNNIIENNITNNTDNIHLSNLYFENITSSDGNIISSNNINKSIRGIFIGTIYHSSPGNKNIIQGNNIKDNFEGISFFNSSNNKIIENYVIKNGLGINIIRSSNNNIISRNYIKGNENFGISIWYSCKYNFFNENTIIENFNQISFSDSYPTFWLRNFWDDWGKNLPRPIYGEIRLERFDSVIPWVQFDWRPVMEPYDIGG